MVTWEWKIFDDLSIKELYELLRLRQQVFVVEQDCVYEDIDNQDSVAWHLLGQNGNDLVAYLRVLGPGDKFQEVSIGRVLINLQSRGSGLGQELMRKGIEKVEQQFPQQDIKISAQYHLSNFYQTFGFMQVSEPYDEDGIMHIDMLRKV